MALAALAAPPSPPDVGLVCMALRGKRGREAHAWRAGTQLQTLVVVRVVFASLYRALRLRPSIVGHTGADW